MSVLRYRRFGKAKLDESAFLKFLGLNIQILNKGFASIRALRQQIADIRVEVKFIPAKLNRMGARAEVLSAIGVSEQCGE